MESEFIRLLLDSSVKYGELTALVDRNGEARCSYRQLLHNARCVASYLKSKGARKGDFITLEFDSSTEFFFCEFGVWLAACVAVPMNPAYPRERKEYIRTHCESRLNLDAEVLKEALQCSPEEEILLADELDNALLVYTSGSTGKPKGVLHDFKSLMNAVAMMKALEPGENDKFAHFAHSYFVSHLLYYMWMFGTEVHIIPNITDIEMMSRYHSEQGITIAHIVASVYPLYRNSSKNLRCVFTGADRVRSVTVPKYKAINVYGQSETAGPVFFANIKGISENAPIGRPVEGISFAILDSDMQPVKDGEEGELCLKGHFAKSYFKEDELTTELYRGEWLHTKDIVRMLPDGNLLYVNRADWMAKINGQRVEPGEVEATICKMEGIRDAIVKGFVNFDGRQYLCGYYISDSVSEDELKSYLKSKLPSYMVPSFLIRMERFPLNANGKKDRQSLEAPALESLASEYSAPKNETESKLCEAFASVLGIERIGADDDFISMGGDSLSIMKLMQLCPELPLNAGIIYNSRTPRGIAKTFESFAESEYLKDVEEVPLSQTQLGIWLECEKRVGEAVYNNPILYRLGSRLDLGRLSTAIEEAIAAHPGLKARFIENSEGAPMMLRNGHPSEGAACTVTRLSEEELWSLKQEFMQPFDLRKDRLYRIRLFETEKAQYLFTDFHHIIYDGTSMHIFLEDVARAYNGEKVESEEFTGFDVALQENSDRNSARYAKARDWYMEQFGAVEEMSLPIPDRNEEQTIYGLQDIILDVKYEDILTLANRLNITPNIIATAAFGRLLCGYSYTHDASFATIYNGRSDIRSARTMSMMVKTLPVHCVMAEGMTVREYLKNVKMQMMGAVAHDIFSFAEVVSATSFNSEVLFVWQGDMAQMPSIGDAALENMKINFNATGEKLCVQINSLSDGLHLSVQYHSNLYSEEFIDGFIHSFGTVLKEMLFRECIDEVRLTDEPEEKHLDSFNLKETVPADTTGETIVSMFRAAARKYPNNTAAVFKDRLFSYRELDSITDRLAAEISNRCVHSNDIPAVSVLIHRNEWMFIASLSVLKAGFAYQPLDPSYPPQRLNFMIKDAGSSLLICDEDLKGILNEYYGETLLTSELAALIARPDSGTDCRLAEPSPDSLFIILYTSGSTGTPKGVMLEHRNLTAFCHWYHRYYGLVPESKVAAYASYGFDACMMDMYPALTSGAQVHIIPEEMRLDLDAINGYFEENGITHSFITTQVGVQFAANIENHSLHHLSVGGEKLISFNPPENYAFHNAYGPTECTIFSTIFPVRANERNIPIGKPLDTLKCYIVDRKLNRLPVGAAGELIICGDQVGRGYLNQPELTAKVFFEINGKRAYHTGDIVRYRPDGNIEFIGRKDGQVKIRGFRIELKEVEAVIREFQGVKDATVQAFDLEGGGKFIAAYIVGSEKIDIQALNNYILKNKPPYMVPAVTMQIDYIPLNVNHKIDKAALPRPTLHNNVEYVAPATGRETLVAEAFRKVLGINGKISALDSFTDLGGDSINALRLATALRQKGMTILVSQILHQGTIKKIAQAATVDEPKSSDFSQTQFSGFVEDTPLLHYFKDLDFARPGYFNQAFLFKSSGKINTAFLGKALEAVVTHHDMLRAVIRDSRLYIRSVSEGKLFSIEEFGDEDITAISTQIQASIDLENGPWVKCAVFRKPEADYLMIAVHHLAVDGISWRIIGEDLNNAYALLESGKKIKLPPKTASYDQYAKALTGYRRSRTFLKEKGYWRGVVEAKMKCDLSWPKEKGFVTDRRILFLDAEHTSLFLRKAHKAYNTQPDDLFLAAVGLAFHRLTGKDSLSIQLESHGREAFDPELEIDRTVGWFTAVFPVVLDHLCEDLRTMVRNTKQIRRMIPDKGFGYPQLMGIDTKDNPLVTFNYLGKLKENFDDVKFAICQDYSVGDMIAPENRYGTDITVNCLQDDDRIRFIVDYNICRYTAGQADSFCGKFMDALVEIIDHSCGVSVQEKTPADFGETKWRDSEFQEILSEYKIFDEEVLAIRHLNKNQIRQIQNIIVNPDSLQNIHRFYIDLTTVVEESVFEEAINELYQKFDSLRSSIAIYGVSTPRLIVTDRKHNHLYYDLSDHEDPWRDFLRIYDIASHLAFNIQWETLLRIVPVKMSDSKMYIILCGHEMLFDKQTLQTLLSSLFRMLESRLADSGNIGEWAELFENAKNLAQENITASSRQPHEGKELKNDTEKQIALIFSELLDYDSDDIYSDSNFVDLGCTPCDLMSLSSEICSRFGTTIPPVRLRENPTVEGIAALLENADEPVEDIHIYSEHPDKRKLFFVHTANTGSEAYFNLARRISNKCSFYAFEQYNLNHPDDMIEGGIPELATKYIELMRSIQPSGPYLLGGWCYGGTVAYEMANQLTKAGEKVDCVIMLDSHIIEDDMMRNAVLKVAKVRNRDYLSTSDLFAGMRSKGLLDQLIRNSIKTSRDWLFYVPPFYAGKVVYFKASVKDYGLPQIVDNMYDYLLNKRAAGYENCIAEGQLSIYEVEEMHDSMMSERSLVEIVPQITKILEDDSY